MRQKLLAALNKVHENKVCSLLTQYRLRYPFMKRAGLVNVQVTRMKTGMLRVLEFSVQILSMLVKAVRSNATTQELSTVSQRYSHKVLKIYSRIHIAGKRLSNFALMGNLY